MRRILSVALAATMVLGTFNMAFASEEVVDVTFFGTNAMSGSGELTGGLGKFFNDRGLNIEVIPYSTEKLQAQLASGDLADVIWLPQQEMLVAAESGLILPLDEYLEGMPAIQEHIDLFGPAFEFAREYNSNDTGNVYYIGAVGPSMLNVAADTERNAVKLNWKIYAEAGYPEFSNLEELIPVLKQMQELVPETEDGLPTYGMNLFTDFDTDHFWNISGIYVVSGRIENYLGWGVEFDPATQTGYSIFEDDSVYYKGLKFMYEMNQAGLIDPDSLSQTRSTAATKITAGAALAGWAGDPGWENAGYYPAVFDDFLPAYSSASNLPTGGYCVSANCKNVDAALKLIDLLADEEALITLVSGYPGDNGRWNYDEDGVPTITQAYIDSLTNGTDLDIPADENIEYWNITYLLTTGTQLKVGTSYNYTLFPSYYDYIYSADLAKDWTAHYGYTYLRELMEDKNWPTAAQTEGYSAFLSIDDDLTVMTKAALKDVIVPGSWRMVFASDEAEFEAVWAEMKEKCESLGINELVQYKLDDIAQAREKWAALNE